jgi:hypothetical protein
MKALLFFTEWASLMQSDRLLSTLSVHRRSYRRIFAMLKSGREFTVTKMAD